MNLNHLALFLAVAEEGSISGGAARLHISQPAVSRQLADFESALGTPLFDRLPRGIRLTGAGEILQTHAKRLFAIEADAQRELSELKGLMRGRLSIGASTTIGSYLLPESLGRFHRRYPDIEIDLRIGNTEEIQAALRAASIDIGFTEGFAEGEDLIVELFDLDELIVIAPSDSPLITTGVPLGAKELARESLVLREAGSGTRAVLERALTALGVAALPRPAMTLAGTEAIKRAVRKGAGIAVVSRLAVEEEIEAGRLSQLLLTEELRVLLQRPLHRLRLKSRQESQAVRAFVASLKRR